MGLRDHINRVKQGGSSTSADRAEVRAMQAAGINTDAAAMEQAQAEAIARRMVSGDAGVRAAFANEISQWADDPEMAGRYMAALRIADQQSPGLASEIVSQTRDASAFEFEFPSNAPPQDTAVVSEADGGEQPARKRQPKNYSNLEAFSTYGAGTNREVVNPETGLPKKIRTRSLTDMVRAALEYRSKADMVRDYGDSSYGQRINTHIANDRLARNLRDEQLGMIAQTPLAPEHVAMLNRAQVSKITGIPPEQIDMSTVQALIGATLQPSVANDVLTRNQMDFITGLASTDFSGLQSRPELADRLAKSLASQGGSNITSDYALERYENMSTREQVLAALRSAASRGTTVQLDQLPGLRALRYPFWTSQNQQLVQPPLAPSGEFAASLFRPFFDPTKTDSTFMSMATPVLERSIREQASSLPSGESFRGLGGQTAKGYAELQLPPARDGSYLLRAEREGEWRFPQFMEGVWMNRGQPRPALNLGGLLIEDIQSAPQPGPTISTPEQVAPPPAEPPPITPADGDVGMYGLPYRDQQLLAALLA